MTSFAWPINARGRDTNVPSYRMEGRAVVLVEAKLSVGQFAGVTAGSSTIPLVQETGFPLVLPAGSRIHNAFIDIVTPVAPASGTNIVLGWSGGSQIFSSTSIETAGMRTYAPTTAQISANRVGFTTDTTIEAIVSVSGTSARTAGEIFISLEIV